ASRDGLEFRIWRQSDTCKVDLELRLIDVSNDLQCVEGKRHVDNPGIRLQQTSLCQSRLSKAAMIDCFLVCWANMPLEMKVIMPFRQLTVSGDKVRIARDRILKQ